jgi:hypothetical protein
MTNEPFEAWARDRGGYVWLTPLATHGAGITEHGGIAVALGGYTATTAGGVQHRSQYVCSPREAMKLARNILRAVAMSDRQAEVPGPGESENKTWVKSRVSPSDESSADEQSDGASSPTRAKHLALVTTRG